MFLKKITIFLLFVLLWSCNEDYDVLPVQTFEAKASSNFVLINQDVNLQAFIKEEGSADREVSNETIFYVNNLPISGTTFTSATVGDYVITAKYKSFEATINLSFHDGTQVNFRKRVLIEDYTGTWCGYCTRVSYAIHQVEQQTDDAVVVAIHRASSVPTNGSYDPYNYDTSEVESLLGATGYPKGYLNRMTFWNTPENNAAQVIGLTQGSNPKIGIAIHNEGTATNLNINVKVKFSADFTDLKLVVFVLENGLIYPQYNYTNYYNAVHPIMDYEHNHVLRRSVTSLLGDAIDANATFSGNVFERNFAIPMPANIEDTNKVDIVAFVVDADGNAINCRKAAVNTTQDFEEL